MTELTALLSEIDVPAERARTPDAVWDEALARLIERQGLLHPILVRAMADGRYRLVAGLRRLRAFEILGRASIPIRLSQAESDEEARLDEVMENLGRQDLIALDRCQHLWVLKQVWERLHPETKRGARGLLKANEKMTKRQSLPSGDADPADIRSDDMPVVFGFSRAVVEEVGLCQRSIRDGVRIWTCLSPASRAALVGTELAEKMTELKALSEHGAAIQAAILNLILVERSCGNVAEALWVIERKKPMTADQRRLLSAEKAINGWDDTIWTHVVATHRDRIVAELKKQGRP
jgi:ParB family chromosome partitioning protein